MHFIFVCLFVLSLCTQSEDVSSLENIYVPSDISQKMPCVSPHLRPTTASTTPQLVPSNSHQRGLVWSATFTKTKHVCFSHGVLKK